MINVNIIQFDLLDKNAKVYTFFPYTKRHCTRIQSTFLLALNQSISIETLLFPNKLRNFFGCPIYLATYNVPPYMILTADSHETSGIEVFHFNFNLNIC